MILFLFFYSPSAAWPWSRKFSYCILLICRTRTPAQQISSRLKGILCNGRQRWLISPGPLLHLLWVLTRGFEGIYVSRAMVSSCQTRWWARSFYAYLLYLSRPPARFGSTCIVWSKVAWFLPCIGLEGSVPIVCFQAGRCTRSWCFSCTTPTSPRLLPALIKAVSNSMALGSLDLTVAVGWRLAGVTYHVARASVDGVYAFAHGSAGIVHTKRMVLSLQQCENCSMSFGPLFSLLSRVTHRIMN